MVVVSAPIAGATFGREITGVDLSVPLSPDDLAALQHELDEHALLVIPQQFDVSPERQATIYKALSPSDPALRTYIDTNSHFPEQPEVHVFGNVDVDEYGLQVSLKPQVLTHDEGEARRTGVPDACGLYFHTDGSFFRTLPPVCTQLYCRVAPPPETSAGVLHLPGGDVEYHSSATGFLDGRLAYDLLSAERQRQLERLHVRYHPEIGGKIIREGLRISSNGLRMVAAEDAEDECGTANDRFDPSAFPTFGDLNTVRDMWPDGSEELHAYVETDATGAACYPLVNTHPTTGRKGIVASAVAVDTLSETMEGEGSLGGARSQELLGEILEPAVRENGLF